MKQLEINLYKYIYDDMIFSLSNIKDCLDWKNNNIIDSWIKHWVDKNYNILFWNKYLSNEQKNAILNLLKDNIESSFLTLLRALEWDLYEVGWYDIPIDREKYTSSHPDWH